MPKFLRQTISKVMKLSHIKKFVLYAILLIDSLDFPKDVKFNIISEKPKDSLYNSEDS